MMSPQECLLARSSLGTMSPQELLLCLVLSSHPEGFLGAQDPCVICTCVSLRLESWLDAVQRLGELVGDTPYRDTGQKIPQICCS